MLLSIHRGEVTAQAIEGNLTSLERKLDDLLASFEAEELKKVDGGGNKTGSQDGMGGEGSTSSETRHPAGTQEDGVGKA